MRKTYPQNRRAYNAAQTSEKATFQVLLRDLCKGIKEPPPNGRGRLRIPLGGPAGNGHVAPRMLDAGAG